MKYLIDTTLSEPAYLQLYRQVRADIIRGIYPYGKKLPSKRSAAQETGVSVITVEHAYDLLREEGYVESRERSGFTVIFRASDGFAPAPAGPTESTLAGADAQMRRSETPAEAGTELPVFPYPTIAKTARRVISEYGDATLIRSPNQGCLALRQALARYLARNQGIHVDAGQIVIGSGAEYLYSLIASLLGRTRTVALESPSYAKIEQVYTSLGMPCELLPLAEDGIESDALAHTGASILHITPYRSFPTGITAPISKRMEYIRWSESGDRYIVEDDFESEFSVTGKPVEAVFSLSPHGNVIYLNTFSKTISPGLRMGYMVLSEDLAQRYLQQLGFLSCTVPTFDQLVVARLIEDGDFSRHINRVRRAKRKQLFSRRKS
ncbi:MAG: PLP-dependent aminotransferase family protein [Eggerthellaceae bacterium]|jgi:GntR family transcriptional regulator/MocR family aminotransferase